MGCDFGWIQSHGEDIIFQSTHPRGVRPPLRIITTSTVQFQSTHPRGVRLNCRVWTRDTDRFQSTHPRGVRRAIMTRQEIEDNFNPRTHVGCDPKKSGADTYVLKFQSTHPRGVRRLNSAIGTDSFLFQSTHPRGVRRPVHDQDQAGDHFNPRTHVGCDSLIAKPPCFYQNSIHAPTWGATNIEKGTETPHLFQSTHPRGVRHPIYMLSTSLSYFNPRTHVGCDI